MWPVVKNLGASDFNFSKMTHLGHCISVPCWFWTCYLKKENKYFTSARIVSQSLSKPICWRLKFDFSLLFGFEYALKGNLIFGILFSFYNAKGLRQLELARR